MKDEVTITGNVSHRLINADDRLADDAAARASHLRVLQAQAETLALDIARNADALSELRQEHAQADHDARKADEGVRFAEFEADKASRRVRDVAGRLRALTENLNRQEAERITLANKIAAARALTMGD